jgi:hypothetical protein
VDLLVEADDLEAHPAGQVPEVVPIGLVALLLERIDVRGRLDVLGQPRLAEVVAADDEDRPLLLELRGQRRDLALEDAVGARGLARGGELQLDLGADVERRAVDELEVGVEHAQHERVWQQEVVLDARLGDRDTGIQRLAADLHADARDEIR